MKVRAYSTAAGSDLSVPFSSDTKAVFTAGKRAARERESTQQAANRSLSVLRRPFPCVLH